MKELEEYYEHWKHNIFKGCIFIWVIMSILFFMLNNCLVGRLQSISNDKIMSYINSENEILFEYLLQYFLGLIAPSGLIILIYTLALRYINEKAWKKKFPNYNIDGEWEDITEYTVEFSKNGYRALEEKKVPSPVIIKQTCKCIEIVPSVGEDFTWQSLLAELEGRQLKIFYKVTYKKSLQDKGFPEYRIGYEEMVIDTSNLSPKQKPVKMSGQFWHCVQNDSRPMYMGDVTYKRN
ncbi:MAG: hypothetical protein HDR13_16715 [Lachnospiraceae bacterium]|nr:hypothetical protein [Lachnospiraceae bacterium]